MRVFSHWLHCYTWLYWLSISGEQSAVFATSHPRTHALGFRTASSEGAHAKLLQQLERFGCDKKVCGLVLPLGYSFNLDGSMLYMTFSVLFIAQAYGIDMALADQLIMLLMLLFTSKGVAGVPRASLIVIAATSCRCSIYPKPVC